MELHKETIHIVRREANIDRACDESYDVALARYGLDDDGYSSRVEFERTTDSVRVKFESYTRNNWEHVYTFAAWIERTEDESDE